MSRATKPSATGPTPPSPNAAGVGRVLDASGHVGDDVAHLGSVRLPEKRGMLAGPVRMASATCCAVTWRFCSDGALVP